MNAYGQAPHYGYGSPQGAAMRGSAGLAKAALALVALRLAFIPLTMVVNPLIVRAAISRGSAMKGVQIVFQIEHSLIGFVVFCAWLMFMLYIRSELVALRASGIMTRFTPGWAIGWWFIPLANIVMPLLVVLDVWKHRLPRASAAVPVLWWVAYLVSLITFNVPIPVPYLGMLVSATAFGLWGTVVYMLMTAPAAAPAAPQGYYPPAPVPQPYGYYPPG